MWRWLTLLTLLGGAVELSPQEPTLLERAYALTDAETDGPLHYPRDLAAGDESLWIADTGNDRLIRVPLDGAPPGSIGREGEGPGEFRVPTQIGITPELDVFVWDRSLGRLTVFTAAGDVKDTRRIDLQIPGLQVSSVLPLNSGWGFLLNTSRSARNPLENEERRAVLVYVDRSHEVVDTLATMPRFGVEARMLPLADRRGGFRYFVFAAFSDAPPFPTWTGACGGLIAVSTGDRSFEVQFFDFDGEHRGLQTRDWVGKRVTEEDQAQYLSRFRMSDQEAIQEHTDFPEIHAPVQGMFLSDDGRLFLRHTLRTVTTGQAIWSSFALAMDADGEVELRDSSVVRMPARFRPRDAGNGLVWGFERGPAGVERVRAYRLPQKSGRCEENR